MLMKSSVWCVAWSCLMAVGQAREWRVKGVDKPVEAEFAGQSNGYVVLEGANGQGAELPLANFAPADQEFIKLLSTEGEKQALDQPGNPLARSWPARSAESLAGKLVTLADPGELHLTSAQDPMAGGWANFTHPDAWLVFENVKPSVVEEKYLDRMLIHGAEAKPGENVRVVQFGQGAVVIPQGDGFPGLVAFSGPNLGGSKMPLVCYEKYSSKELKAGLKGEVQSFFLKRGYMATLAENEDGTGTSRNFVAQDHDVLVPTMPKGLDKGVKFVRVFPWCWTSKRGIAGGIHEKLNVGWFYDWNIGAHSTPDLEYVAIKQKRWWPGMDQDWHDKGINHLLGFNEPDRPDQAKMTVDEAIAGWPELLGTGLRLGSPATSDGGTGWLYEFMEKAERKGLRVDFVAIHYYRGVGNAGDAKGAAKQMLGFLENVHRQVKRPLWVTEWNNGANWTNTPEPDEKQQRDAIEEMIKMLDEAPFVERYALYNWVQNGRKLLRDDGSLTPAGIVYRDKKSPVFFTQPKSYK